MPKMTSKGQVTIPKKVRDHLGLKPGSEVEFEYIGDGRIVLGMSHGLSGNPSRFRDGAITLQSDEAWRAAMPRQARVGRRCDGTRS